MVGAHSPRGMYIVRGGKKTLVIQARVCFQRFDPYIGESRLFEIVHINFPEKLETHLLTYRINARSLS